MILIFVLRTDDVEHEIKDVGLMQRPNHLVVQAGVVVGTTLDIRTGGHLQHVANQHEHSFDQQALLLGTFGPILRWRR